MRHVKAGQRRWGAQREALVVVVSMEKHIRCLCPRQAHAQRARSKGNIDERERERETRVGNNDEKPTERREVPTQREATEKSSTIGASGVNGR